MCNLISPISSLVLLSGENLNITAPIQKTKVPVNAMVYPNTPQAMPAAREANHKGYVARIVYCRSKSNNGQCPEHAKPNSYAVTNGL